jgi:hypothetical protein
MAIGVCCLVLAATVGAQQANEKKPSVDNIPGQTEQAKANVERMHKMVSEGFKELEEARKAQNISRVNCVNDALTAMKGLLRLAESNFLAMQEAASRNDAGDVEHEYVKISIAFNKCEELYGQLQGCGGPSTGGAIDGKPYIEKQVDPDMPDVDPTAELDDIPMSIEDPPSASPFFTEEGQGTPG